MAMRAHPSREIEALEQHVVWLSFKKRIAFVTAPIRRLAHPSRTPGRMECTPDGPQDAVPGFQIDQTATFGSPFFLRRLSARTGRTIPARRVTGNGSVASAR
jgi:hypothetical protein